MIWEYETLKITAYTEDHFEQRLNEMGVKGWELVGKVLNDKLVFKRPNPNFL